MLSIRVTLLCLVRAFAAVFQIRFLLLISRQGKVRLTKWYSPYTQKDKARIMREVTSMVLSRPPKMCNFIEWKEKKIVYKRCGLAVRVCRTTPGVRLMRAYFLISDTPVFTL